MADSEFTQRATPGVYVTERGAFSPTVVGVPTTVPAFIGYTETATISGRSVRNQAIKIGSMADYTAIFGGPYRPAYEITPVAAEGQIAAGKYDFKVFDPTPGVLAEKYFNLERVGARQFNLFDSLRLFYDNGGGDAYVVSVGDYDAAVAAADLSKGLDVLNDVVGLTMLVIPDAVLLSDDGRTGEPWVSAGFQTVVRKMLQQAAERQDRVAILDVYGSQYTDRDTLDPILAQFRNDVGNLHLSYGVAYFPFLDTTVVDVREFTYDNIETSSQDTLKQILGWQNAHLYGADGIDCTEVPGANSRYCRIQLDIEAIPDNPASSPTGRSNNNDLLAALPVLGDIFSVMAARSNVLPPSAAMAGLFTANDDNRGVWNAPTNLVVNSVSGPTYRLSDTEQGDLNLPVDGKAVDAIRDFVGRGTLVWGVRTLDGNSNDWRYIQVRRTLIYIEQSIKAALQGVVFAANDATTWAAVVAMVSNFLQGLWSQGALLGAKPDEAFTVQCGLGSTMTASDILDGYMVVQVTLQMVHPAEFIELTVKQKMEAGTGSVGIPDVDGWFGGDSKDSAGGGERREPYLSHQAGCLSRFRCGTGGPGMMRFAPLTTSGMVAH